MSNSYKLANMKKGVAVKNQFPTLVSATTTSQL